MGSIYTQMLLKALASGAPPQTPPNSEGERLRRLPVWHAKGKGRQFPSSPRAPETLGTPLVAMVQAVVWSIYDEYYEYVADHEWKAGFWNVWDYDQKKKD